MNAMSQFFKSMASTAVSKLLMAVAAALLVLAAGKVILRLMNKTVGKSKIDPTLQKFLIAAIRVIIYFLAFMIVVGSMGFELSSLVALASVVSAAFALAASSTLSNLFGGILLLMTKPFGVGDYVTIGDESGIVQMIGLLNTEINSMDNKRIVMPNSSISSATIVNYSTEGKRRVDLVFQVGYENDIELVKTAIRSTAELHEKVIDKEKIFVRVSAYNDSNVSYTLRAWVQTADYWDVYHDLLEQVKYAFDEMGITMVFPHMNVIMSRED